MQDKNDRRIPEVSAAETVDTMHEGTKSKTRRLHRLKFLSGEFSQIAYFADFVIYLSAIGLITISLVHFAPPQFRIGMVISALAGLATWSLIEYAMHRLVFHGVEPFKRIHCQHHLRPQALIATPTLLSGALIMAFIGAPTMLIGGWWLGCSTTLGVTVGYFAYGVIHHAVHHWRSRSAWMQQRKRLHAIHHRLPHFNYGVTTSFWDHLFASKNA